MQAYSRSITKVFLFIGTILSLLLLMIQPVQASDYDGSTNYWLTLAATPYVKKVCPKQTLELSYVITFNNSSYVTNTIWNGKEPQKPDSPPDVRIMSSQGKLSDHNAPKGAWNPVTKVWMGSFKLTVEKKGYATIRIDATYLGATAWDSLKINVSESCAMDVEIKADESSLRLSTGKTVNEAQKDWSLKVFLDGKAKDVLANPLVNEGEGGDGGLKRLLAKPGSILVQDDATGTIEIFGDGIWLGNEADFVCGTKGAITCTHDFVVHPVVGEETIDYQIDMLPGQCSSFTVWCKGPDGGGETTIPPMSGLSFQMNAEIPWEGGSAHYIHRLPYGVTMDYLIIAVPVEEE